MLTDINTKENGFLILENFPCGTEVGIDYHSWFIGERFEGISNVPPGVHLLFFSVTDKYGGRCPRVCVFFFISAEDVLSWMYNAKTEEMVEHTVIEDIRRIRCSEHVREVAKFLAPYPAEECKIWLKLTNCISEDLCNRLNPQCNRLGAFSWVDTDDIKGKEEIDVLQHHQQHRIRFMKLPPKFPSSSSAQDITAYGIDSSHSLQQLVINHGEEDLLGEMQYTFLCFLIAQVYDAFEHWKHLVILITDCKQALSQKSDFFKHFVDILDLQTKEIPQEFFVDIVAQNNFLYKAFQNFFLNCESEESLAAEFVVKVSLLKGNLERRFDWEFVDNEEDLPAVVDL